MKKLLFFIVLMPSLAFGKRLIMECQMETEAYSYETKIYSIDQGSEYWTRAHVNAVRTDKETGKKNVRNYNHSSYYFYPEEGDFRITFSRKKTYYARLETLVVFEGDQAFIDWARLEVYSGGTDWGAKELEMDCEMVDWPRESLLK